MHIESRASFRMRALAAGLGLALLGTALGAAPATAKPGGSGTATGAGNANCVVSLQRGSDATGARTACFATFTQAIRFATNGAVTDAPATAAQGAKTPTLADKLAAAKRVTAGTAVVQQAVIGIEYDAANYGMDSWSIIIVGNAACTASTTDVDYQWSMPEYLGGKRIWDAVSSYETFFNDTVCFAAHYWLSNYGVPRTEFTSSRPSMPSLNVSGGPFTGDNNARSVQWS